MILGIVLLACVPAYLAAGGALVMGASWLVSLGVLMGTGSGLVLIFACLALWLGRQRGVAGKHVAV